MDQFEVERVARAVQDEKERREFLRRRVAQTNAYSFKKWVLSLILYPLGLGLLVGIPVGLGTDATTGWYTFWIVAAITFVLHLPQFGLWLLNRLGRAIGGIFN